MTRAMRLGPRGVVLALVLLASGCASGGGTRRIAGDLTIPIAAELTALPYGATFAWVPPDVLLGRLRPEDRRTAESGVLFGLRNDVSTLVRSHAWREADPRDADYLLTLVQIERGVRPIATSVQAPGRTTAMPICLGRQGESKNVNCVPASSLDANKGRSWVSYVIRRRRDGAQFVRVIPVEPYSDLSELPLPDLTLRLLLSAER